MTPAQIKQALNIRMLRADKAERALRSVRMAESQAVMAVQAIEAQLADFDASFEARLEAFYAKTASGMHPDSLHSARSFHSDLAGQRAGIDALLPEAWQVVEGARQQVQEARAVWTLASRAADNLKDLHAQVVMKRLREQERLAEQDADELSVSRAYRNAGQEA